MASVINYIIPTQRFETIRDAIGVIIAQELAKQKTLTTNVLFDAVTYVERFMPFDNTELPAVNVYFNDSKFSNQDHVSATAEMTFYVDVTTSAYDSASNRGDKQASINCHKLLGVLRAILSSGEYRFLGLSQGIIQQRAVTDLQMSAPQPIGDSLHVISGRLTLKIKANEINSDLSSIVLTEIFTNFTIEETGLGNKIKILNN